MYDVFKIIGAIGLLSITAGVLIKGRISQDILYIIGGIFLEVYSIAIQDWIFIILQVIFIIAVFYDLIKLKFFSHNII